MNGRRGFAIEFTSLARARLTAEQRSEIYAWAGNRKVRVYVWYKARERRYEAILSVGDNIVSARAATPYEAFLSAAATWETPVVSMFSGPAA